MQKQLPLLALLLALFSNVYAQEYAPDEAIFNHYVQNPIILNPAAAGFSNDYTIQLNTRAQWSGFEDSPKTVVLRANGPIGNSFGIGAAVFSESAAQIRRLKGQLDVGFRFGFGREIQGQTPFQAAFGFHTQFQRTSLDGGIVNNPQFDAGDGSLMNYLDGNNTFDAGVGIYATYLDKTFAGFTINNLVSNRLENISGALVEESGVNYTFLVGQNFLVDELNVKLTPSLMLRNVIGSPFMMDINLQAGFLDDQFIAGLSYRNLGALGLLLGTKLNGFQLYYSYDLGFGGLQSYSNGSHELTLGYSISRRDIARSRQQRAKDQNRR